MKKNIFFSLTFFLTFLILSAQQNNISYILEINEDHPAAFRDDLGRVNLYFTIPGLISPATTTDLLNGFQKTGGVEEISITEVNAYGSSFYMIFFTDAKMNYFKKLFITNGILQTLFFGELFDIETIEAETILNKLSL
jgi:hypothetical protein